MRPTILIAALALAGCATDNCPPPGIQLQTVTKTVEVQRPCAVTQPKRPAPLATPLPTDAVQLAAMLGAKLYEYAGPGGYADRAHDAIETCTKP